MTRGVGQRDVERILRDVLTTYGVAASELRVVPTQNGWSVMVTEPSGRLTTDITAGRPAIVRAALTDWVLNQH